MTSHQGNYGKQDGRDDRPNVMIQTSSNSSESPFSRQSMGSIYDNYEASEAAQKRRLAAQHSALYHSSSLPCPLRSFVSIGRSPSRSTNTVAVPAPPAAAAAVAAAAARAVPPDPAAVAGMLPTFSPVFTGFGRHTSLESVRSQPIAIPPADAYPSTPLSASTGPLSRTTDSGMSAAYADTADMFRPAMSRTSFAEEDMEVSYRDWHNGVFSPSW